MRKSILLLGDLAILYAALMGMLLIRYGAEYHRNFLVHLLPFTIIFAVWLLVFYIANLYELSVVKNTISFFSTYFSVMAINIGIAITFFYLVPFIGIAPKRNLFIFIALALALEVVWRTLYNQLLVKSGYRNNTLIVGLSEQSQELYDFLLADPQLGYNALGIVDIQNEAAARTLEKLIREKHVKTLVIAREVYALPDIVEVLYRLVPLKLRFFNLPNFSERVTGKIPLSTIDQSWFLDNLSDGSKRAYELAKRLFDILGALVLGIMVLPVMGIIIVAIKIYTPGSIFYQQTRKGKAGQPFIFLKFRTMIPQAELGGAVWAQTNDPRITRVGRFLRKTRLDEIPQLWNVLIGDLSLVGPRPERPEFHGELSAKIPFYNERYLIKPGAMGWAQLKYRYGASVHDAAEKLQYDLYYVKNRSLLLDASIVLRTINIILRQAGR
ncbi:MAG: sugar transferase [Patescibacteria group bacterium]